MLRSRRLAPSHYSDSQFKSKGVNTKKPFTQLLWGHIIKVLKSRA
jgi:hypothetical protein